MGGSETHAEVTIVMVRSAEISEECDTVSVVPESVQVSRVPALVSEAVQVQVPTRDISVGNSTVREPPEPEEGSRWERVADKVRALVDPTTAAELAGELIVAVVKAEADSV